MRLAAYGAVAGGDPGPLLRGQGAVVREWLHFEHAPCYSRVQAYHALTDGHVKYVCRPLDGREHLFDLDGDPREERDLALVPEAKTAVAAWRKRLVACLADRPEGFVRNGRLVPGVEYKPLNEGRLS